MAITKTPTRHSSLRCLLTQQRSTLSVFCCKAAWEMATLNISLNKMDSVAGWTFVRNRQLTSVEEGRRATLKYLQRMRAKWISEVLRWQWMHSHHSKLSAKEKHRGTWTLLSTWSFAATVSLVRLCSAAWRFCSYPSCAGCAPRLCSRLPWAAAKAFDREANGSNICQADELNLPPAHVQPSPR